MGDNIGKKIRDLRKEKGMTLKELAGDRVTASQISFIENGKCNPSKELLVYIAGKLGVDVECLLISDKELKQKKFQNIIDKYVENITKDNIETILKEIEQFKDCFEELKEQQKGFYHLCFGKKYYFDGRYNSSFNEFTKSLVYYVKTDKYDIIADLYISLGNCCFMKNRYELSFGYYKNAEDIIQKGISIENVARVYHNLALCSLNIERYTLFNGYIQKLENIIRENELDKKQEYIVAIDMMKGSVNFNLKDAEDSFIEFQNAYNKYKQNNDLDGMVRAKNNMAASLWEQGKREESVSMLKKTIEEILETKYDKNLDLILVVYINLIDGLKNMGKYDEVLDILNTAEEYMLKKNYIDGIIKILNIKFSYYIDKKDYQRAEDYAFYILDFLEKNKREEEKIDIYIKLSEMHRNIGNNKEWMEYLILSKNFKI